jgi:hypothetical protein
MSNIENSSVVRVDVGLGDGVLAEMAREAREEKGESNPLVMSTHWVTVRSEHKLTRTLSAPAAVDRKKEFTPERVRKLLRYRKGRRQLAAAGFSKDECLRLRMIARSALPVMQKQLTEDEMEMEFGVDESAKWTEFDKPVVLNVQHRMECECEDEEGWVSKKRSKREKHDPSVVVRRLVKKVGFKPIKEEKKNEEEEEDQQPAPKAFHGLEMYPPLAQEWIVVGQQMGVPYLTTEEGSNPEFECLLATYGGWWLVDEAWKRGSLLAGERERESEVLPGMPYRILCKPFSGVHRESGESVDDLVVVRLVGKSIPTIARLRELNQEHKELKCWQFAFQHVGECVPFWKYIQLCDYWCDVINEGEY